MAERTTTEFLGTRLDPTIEEASNLSENDIDRCAICGTGNDEAR